MNIMTQFLIAAGLVFSSLAAPAAANADPIPAPTCIEQGDYSLDVGESMCWPPQPNTIVVVQGPKYMWGLRKVASYVDRRVDRLTVISAVGVRCNELQFQNRDNVFCLTVRKRQIEPMFWGLYAPETFDGTATKGTITLNSRYNRRYLPDRQHAAGHEFLHALGMQHHNGLDGLCSANWQTTLPSRKEIIALQWWYEFDNTN